LDIFKQICANEDVEIHENKFHLSVGTSSNSVVTEEDSYSSTLFSRTKDSCLTV